MEKKYNVCVTCLSSDRDLISLHKITNFLEEISFILLKTYDAAICWECQSIIMKFYRFRKKALKAQTSLYTELENIKSLSNLQTKVTKIYNYKYYSDFDPLNVCDKEPKLENSVKDEVSELKEFTDDNLTDTDDNKTSKDKKDIITTDTVNIKESNFKKRNLDEKEIEQKFIKVVFTEEEMIKNREDKRNHHNFKKLPYKCDSCVLGFTRKETLAIHLVKKHNELIGALVCDVCKVRFTTESAMTSHRMKHYICYKCRICKYATIEQWSAWNHCKLKHERDRLDSIHCGQCDAVFKTPGDLEEHIQTNHTIYCSECGVRFKGKDTLRRHKARIHAIKREFICDICTKTFKNKTRLESHMVSHNSNIARKLSYCYICKVQYKNIYVYRSHLKNSANHSDKTYSCPECNKKFVSKVYWTQHYNFYHLHKSQYKCELCNKLYISDWRLKNHKQIHHGLSRSRDHHCNICGKKFFTISSLRNHKLTHSDQRSYMCEDCGDTFKQRPALYTHAKLVHGVGRKK